MSHSDGVATVLRIEPRWTDLDPVGHVNNNVFLVYAEEARARYLHATLPDSWEQIVVVHNAIDYHRPVEVSDIVEVSSSVSAVGNSSLTTVNVIATAEGTRCATVRTVQVVLRDDRKATRPWSERERGALQNLMVPRQ
ncbi:thioesterase superfamily protein [Mycolicibacterium rhodesiae JS60]|nr:thioesterase superfamily protein [Mycolicibacterium rhodesiae JS60]